MDEDFSRHVSPEKRFSAQVFEFVEWANWKGRALELLRCAAEGNERNAGLQTLWADAQRWDTTLVQPAKATEPNVSPAAPHHVFLAYSRKDSEVMRQLRADLLAAGIIAWIDQEDLGPGAPVWEDAIEAAIRSAKCVVALLSPDAKQARWFRREISRAEKLGRRIFPVLASGDEESSFPLSLDTEYYIDIRTDYASGVQGRLIPALRKHLGMTDAAGPVQQVEAPVRSAEKDSKPAGIVTATQESAKRTPQVSRPKTAIVKPRIDIEWVTIPAGEFLMGSDKKKDKRARDNETPQHRLHLLVFQIGKYPVTNAQYQVFVKAIGYRVPSHWENGDIPKGKENHPVTSVSWEDALAFCKWAGLRLPSEAEREKAARGVDGRIWPWGNEPPTKERCNYGRNVGDTTPVGQYPNGASPYGCLDMAGNVWEWTGSLHEPYPYRSDDGREDPKRIHARTLRGGSWYGNDDYVRCAYRGWGIPGDGNLRVGFRVVSPGF
jgi:formylglycine-generating enzyme required for sulfatase activity